ncbi:ParB N-terminal domain-containing protein [Yoonia sp.]|uniref:ParB/RepB/Spo0J family partition protein n=1 Tax=Yoonia sp. TaxID=2212373 RepID=UPI001A06BF85|nr:ParB N-terminal domain-containing protein [Yoonia sp.]MBE0414337.1 ParB N-terminal domain-containing protein [Yoonia sp.]
MAKRKRLSPAAALSGTPDGPLETKAYVNGWEGVRPRPAPIADVSGDASLRAALAEVTDELTAARNEGRFVVRLPLDAVDAAHLVRDRITMDADDQQSLIDSLRARGQQTPIEVVDLGGGHYGLISGWRRLTALRQLADETGDARFTQVQALVRQPGSAAAAYLAMVEENEIRANLSFYERARIAVQAVRQGVHDDAGAAVAALFAAARAPKRSKILSFVTLVEALDTHLQFPGGIPEKLGLSLVTELRADPGFRRSLTEALRKAAPTTPDAERRVLEHCLKPAAAAPANPPPPPAAPKAPDSAAHMGEPVAPGITLTEGNRRLTLAGPGITPALAADLRAWLIARNG